MGNNTPCRILYEDFLDGNASWYVHQAGAGEDLCMTCDYPIKSHRKTPTAPCNVNSDNFLNGNASWYVHNKTKNRCMECHYPIELHHIC